MQSTYPLDFIILKIVQEIVAPTLLSVLRLQSQQKHENECDTIKLKTMPIIQHKIWIWKKEQ